MDSSKRRLSGFRGQWSTGVNGPHHSHGYINSHKPPARECRREFLSVVDTSRRAQRRESSWLTGSLKQCWRHWGKINAMTHKLGEGLRKMQFFLITLPHCGVSDLLPHLPALPLFCFLLPAPETVRALTWSRDNSHSFPQFNPSCQRKVAQNDTFFNDHVGS